MISISTSELSLFYGKSQVLRNISIQIPHAAVTAIVGPSGCGKSSFLRSLNRLTDLDPGCQVTGSIRVGTLEVGDRRCDVVALRRRVGMIFQSPSPFPLSIRRNIELPLREHGMLDPRDRCEAIEVSLRSVGLWDEIKDRLDSNAMGLSGGQQQRLCIARAIALQPEVLLLDEPCSALDPISSGVVEDLIHELRRQYTIVVVTHNLAQAKRIADYASLFWVIDGAGQLIESSPAADFFSTPSHKLTAAYVSGMRG